MNAYCVLYLDQNDSTKFKEFVTNLNTDSAMSIVVGIEDEESVEFKELLEVFEKTIKSEFGDGF